MVTGDRLLATEHETRLDRLLSQVIGEDLIDADAAAQLGTFLQGRSGEDVPGLPRMNADAGGVSIEQTVDDVQL